jgi:hypothetical protein
LTLPEIRSKWKAHNAIRKAAKREPSVDDPEPHINEEKVYESTPVDKLLTVEYVATSLKWKLNKKLELYSKYNTIKIFKKYHSNGFF